MAVRRELVYDERGGASRRRGQAHAWKENNSKKIAKKEEQRNKISFIQNYRKNVFGTVTGAWIKQARRLRRRVQAPVMQPNSTE